MAIDVLLLELLRRLSCVLVDPLLQLLVAR
jgi:hypothetical protein